MRILALTVLLAISLAAAQGKLPFKVAGVMDHHEIDPTTQFIFFSVLEGLYADGVSNQDVDQILLRNEGQSYFHFVYACPICTTTIWALETYRARPEHFYGMKMVQSTFGSGLSVAQKKQLYSPDSDQRLTVINALVNQWISRRMDAMNLSAEARKALRENLEKFRQTGGDMLKRFRTEKDFEVAESAPAYTKVNECAACNGAVGKLLQLPGDPPKK